MLAEMFILVRGYRVVSQSLRHSRQPEADIDESEWD